MSPEPRIRIDATAPDAPYEQIRTQIAAQVASGELPPGTRLPTVRSLATTLGIAPNTVARAYRELEHSGVVTTRGRNGTVVNGEGADREAIGGDQRRAGVEANPRRAGTFDLRATIRSPACKC